MKKLNLQLGSSSVLLEEVFTFLCFLRRFFIFPCFSNMRLYDKSSYFKSQINIIETSENVSIVYLIYNYFILIRLEFLSYDQIKF